MSTLDTLKSSRSFRIIFDRKAKMYYIKLCSIDLKQSTHCQCCKLLFYQEMADFECLSTQVFQRTTITQHLIGGNFILQQDNDPEHS